MTFTVDVRGGINLELGLGRARDSESAEFLSWLNSLGIEKSLTWRVEIHEGYFVVFQDTLRGGLRYFDYGHQIAQRKPFKVPYDDLPDCVLFRL